MRKHLNRCLCIVRCVKSKAPAPSQTAHWADLRPAAAGTGCSTPQHRKIKISPPAGIQLGELIFMPVMGVEPIRCHHQRILSPSRLPIPTHRRVFNFYIIPAPGQIVKCSGGFADKTCAFLRQHRIFPLTFPCSTI